MKLQSALSYSIFHRKPTRRFGMREKMGISVFERRKFVRLPVNLGASINKEIQGAIKTLSLGGCLIETHSVLDPEHTIRLIFSVIGERFEVTGRAQHRLEKNQFSIRFEALSNEQNIRLAKVIEKIHENQTNRRPTRIALHQDARLDREPALLTNLSEGGCFLQTQNPFHPNDIVEIKFKLTEEEIHLAGQVRWVNPKGVGVEYLSPEPNQITSISKFIEIHSPALN